ncbi:MAG: efflux RND transporter periplasmic adaptor subunit [Candidatus Anammoximicrobium sp.]|nr:efflux RND transporter periplasmic adaptor subunit [Candidatus Anammoximicrobium sp.]
MSYARKYPLRQNVASEAVRILDAPEEGCRSDEASAGSSVVGLGQRREAPASSAAEAASAWQRWLLWTALAAGLVAAGLVGLRWFRQGAPEPTQPLIYHAVTLGDLPITVTERGNLESQSNVEIICEVDDIDGDGVMGTQIISIVPNGTSAKQGDLLVEFDSTQHRERLDRQILSTESARAVQIQAQAKYDNQITQNETQLADALLDVELANLEQEMFVDKISGTHKLEVEAIERLVEDINNEILGAKGNLELKRNEQRGIEALFKLGYAGKHQLDQSVLDLLQAESQYVAKINKLNTQLATLKKKQTYERQMEELTLQGKKDTAGRQVEQVKRNAEALLAQAKAALDAANQHMKKEEERLLRYTEQIDKCKITAPQDGMVAYSMPDRYYGEEIREGASIRPRQKILSLPNLSQMQVKTSVHESVLDQVKPDLTASVRVDAFPERLYRGTVKSVAVLPDQGGWFNSDTKVYQTIVTIDEPVERLKPGMTAVVEIRVDRLQNVVTVPIQAVVQVGKETACYVAGAGAPVRRSVKLGRTNDKAVQILEGVAAGDRVVLNPMAIAEEVQRPADGEPKQDPEGAQPAATASQASPPTAARSAVQDSPRAASKPAEAS